MDCKKVYQEFMSFCSQALANEDPKFLEMIKIKFKACREDFRNSEAMVRLLKETQSNMEKEKSRKFVHLKDLMTEFKAQSAKKIKRDHKRQLSDDSETEVQTHKSVKLMACSVFLEKADEEETRKQILEDSNWERQKVCLISSGIPDSVQEINVATNECLLKELSDSQDNCSTATPFHDSRSVYSPHKTSLVDNSVTISASLRSPSCIEHYKHNKRKSTTIVNIDFSKSPEIQKICVSPHLISRHSTLSRAKSNDLATGSIDDKKSDNNDLGKEDEKAGPNLDVSPYGCAEAHLKVDSGAIVSSEAKNKTFNDASPDCDNIAKHFNEEKCSVEGSGLDMATLETEEMTEDIPLFDVDVSSASSSAVVSDSAEQILQKHLSVENVVEKAMSSEVKVALIDCQQFSPRPPKRALLKPVDIDDYVTDEKFLLAQDRETKTKTKSKTLESESQDSSHDFEEPKTPTEVAVDSKYKRHVRKLENLLESLQNEIEKCQNQELSLDNMEDETSAYIYEDKLKKKFVAAWSKLCEITNRSVSTGRPTERTIKYEGTRYKEINGRLERFLNKKKIFPDFTDIKNIVTLTNKKYKLNLNSSSIDTISREAFVDIGELLQTRRHQDFIATFGNRHTDYICSNAEDPYMTDPELRRKLDKNRKVAKSSLDEVIAKFSKLQDERKDNDNDDDDEEEHTYKDIDEEEKNVKTKRKICSEEEDESDDERIVPAETSQKSGIPSSKLATNKTRYLELNDSALSEKADQSLKSSTTVEPLTSYAKPLCLPLATLDKSDNLSQRYPLATPESVIVIEESPRKSAAEISAQLKVHCGNEKGDYDIDSTGFSRQNPILLKGPNLKFTARKLYNDKIKLSPTGSEISLTKSYDDIALENEEDEEDQSSESDNARSDDDDDDDIMIIDESLSEADSGSSREPSPVSVISLGSSIDDIDDVGIADGLQCTSPSIKQELDFDSGRLLNSAASSFQRSSISESLDLASNSSFKGKRTKDSCAAQGPSRLSTEFLDLAISKTKCTNIVSTMKENSSPEAFSPLILSSCSYDSLMSGSRSFKPIEWNEDEMNEADAEPPDKVEITIEVDEECYDSGLLIAAENDSYIIHQTLSKSLQECDAVTGINSTAPLQADTMDSVINIDEFSNDSKLPEQKTKSQPMELGPVIVIDEASQEVGVQAKGMAVTEKENSGYFHGVNENLMEPCNTLSSELSNAKIEESNDNHTANKLEKSVLVTDCVKQSVKTLVPEHNTETLSETSDKCLVGNSQQSPDEKTADSVMESDEEVLLIPGLATEERYLDDTNASNLHSDSMNRSIDSQQVHFNMNDDSRPINRTASPEAKGCSIESDVSDVQISHDIASFPDVLSYKLPVGGEMEQDGNIAIAKVTEKLIPQSDKGALSKSDCPMTKELKASTSAVGSGNEVSGVNAQSTEVKFVSNEDVINKEHSSTETVEILREVVDEPVTKDAVQTSPGLWSEEDKSTSKDDVQASTDLGSEEDKTVNNNVVQASTDLGSEENKSVNSVVVQASTDLGSEEDKTVNKDVVQASTDLGSEEDKTVNKDVVQASTDLGSEEDKTVNNDVVQASTDLGSQEDKSVNNVVVQASTDLGSEEDKTVNKDVVQASTDPQSEEDKNKPSSVESKEDCCEEEDVFKSIFRLCDEMIQNSEPKETMNNNRCEEKAASSDALKSISVANELSEVENKDNPLEQALAEPPIFMEVSALKNSTSSICEAGDETVADNSLPAQSASTDVAKKSDSGEGTLKLLVSDTESADKECSPEGEQKRNNCEDEVEIIEELSNAMGQRQCLRTKEEDRQWISQQLDKLSFCGAKPTDTSSSDDAAAESLEQGKDSESVIEQNEDGKPSETAVLGSETMPDLDMEVECIDETPVPCLNEQAMTSNGGCVEDQAGISSGLKRKRENPVSGKFDTSQSSSVDKPGLERLEPNAKKRHIDADFITELISSVYNGIIENKPKKPPASQTCDEDEDVLVVEAHFKSKTLSRPSQPSLPRNRITNIPSQVRNYSSATSTFARTNQRSTLLTASTSTSNSNHLSPMTRALPSLNPRVPIPNIQSPSVLGNPRYPTRPFQYNMQRKPNTNLRPYIPNHVARTGLTSPYFKGIPSPAAPMNSFRPGLAFQRNQRPQLGALPPTRQYVRTQQRPVNNTKQLARNLNNTEIVLDDSDSEDQRNGPPATPVILSVTSLSSAKSPANQTTAKQATKQANVKKSGDIIVLSDSD